SRVVAQVLLAKDGQLLQQLRAVESPAAGLGGPRSAGAAFGHGGDDGHKTVYSLSGRRRQAEEALHTSFSAAAALNGVPDRDREIRAAEPFDRADPGWRGHVDLGQ